MNEMKWTWVLFVAASLAVLIRMAMWFLPSPAVRHAEQVESAVEQTALEETPLPIAPEPEAMRTPDEEPEDPFWTDDDEPWEVAEPIEWVPPPPSPPPRDPGPPPEEFFFRRTRWGMTQADVRAAEAGDPVRENDRALLYVTTTLDMPSLLAYVFVQDYLLRARLSFSDPSGTWIPPLSVAQAQQRFLFLREQLRMRYGDPIQQTTHMPRDVSTLQLSARKQDELAQQYDQEIAVVQERIRRQRALLETRYERWRNRAELVARGLAPYERDLRDLQTWKKEALELAAQSRRNIQEQRQADASAPLIAVLSARWPHAREVHDIELRLDFRYGTPRLDIRYQAAGFLPEFRHMDEL